jgi:hypothetical protein
LRKDRRLIFILSLRPGCGWLQLAKLTELNLDNPSERKAANDDAGCRQDEGRPDEAGHGTPDGWAFSGEPSERNERPERKRGRRVRCNAMLGGSGLSDFLARSGIATALNAESWIQN